MAAGEGVFAAGEQRGDVLLHHFSAFLGEETAWQVWGLQPCPCALLAAAAVCPHGQGLEASSAWEGSWTERGATVFVADSTSIVFLLAV